MADPLLGRMIHKRFRLEALLGSGGMGVVYRARHLLIDRVVAIKILQPGKKGADHFRAWFLREARASNRVNHANIVEIYDYGETDDGLAFLVMEYLDGTQLNELIARGPIPAPRALDIIEQCTAALGRAHDLGVVHRDFKPDNVFLLDRGGRKDFVKILDFGLARMMQEAPLTAKGAVFGTPEYMSPEQTRGEDATPASDLYALGVVFYEMLTSRLPFEAPDRGVVMEQHRSTNPPPPSRHVPTILPMVEAMVLRLLEKDPARRYTDAHHLHEEVKALQRMAPRSPWEMATEPSVAGGRLPRVGGVAAWSLRATMFARMTAAAYPGGGSPAPVTAALDNMWKLSAQAARVEGEMSADAAALEGLERKGRERRAQIGRRVEELGREVSQGRRRVVELSARRDYLARAVDEARGTVTALRGRISALEVAGEMGADLREAYQALGAADARLTARKEEFDDVEARIGGEMSRVAAVESQLSAHRAQLEQAEDSMETDLGDVRRRLGERGEEAARFDRDLMVSSEVLMAALAGRSECEAILREMESLVGLPKGDRRGDGAPSRAS